MADSTLFNRIVNVKVFNTKTASNADGSLSLDQIDKTGTLFTSRFDDGSTGFRIRAKANKIEGSTSAIANPATVSIYNLGPDSRALLSKTNNLVIIEAGYQSSPKQIFKGQIHWAVTRKDGPDYITEVQLIDGLFAFQNAAVDTSFNKGVQTNQVINTLVGALKGSGVGVGQVSGVPNSSYNQGIALSGSAVAQLKQVCDKNNLHFAIQDGNILILPFGSDRGTPAYLISPNTGMIGIPEVRSPDAQGNPSLVSVKSLLIPDLGLFQNVVLQSKFVNGVFTTARVTHDVDSWEGPFFTQIECYRGTA